MGFCRTDDGITTVADARRGDLVQIGHIAFDSVRLLCDELGLAPGCVARCRDAGPAHLVLETEAGRTVRIERRWAAFVEARRLARPRTSRAAAAARATLGSEHEHEHVVQGVRPGSDAEAA